MNRSVGAKIGVGRVSDVFAYGTDSVVKVPRPEVPDDWPSFEAGLCRAAYGAGLPAPEVRGVVEVDGRPAVVFERIDGRSMWEQLVDDAAATESLGRELASIQRQVHAVGVLAGVPDFVDRLQRRVYRAEALSDVDRNEAIGLAHRLPRGAALLHGDLHPGNVLMSPAGPVVIDWFDASIGHPVADIVRSSILLRPGRGGLHRHLPGATDELLARLHRSYVDAFEPELTAARDTLDDWQAAVAAGRLAEGAEVDEQRLVDLWAARVRVDASAVQDRP